MSLRDKEINEIDKSDISVERGFYSREDVKEFIRLLKDEILFGKPKSIDTFMLSSKEVIEIINKLAGEELT